MKFVSTSDFEIAVEDRGDGPPILFAHGFPLDHTMWQAQLDHFSKTHRCIAPDLRGFGKSAPVTAHTISMQRMADNCSELLKKLDVNQPVIFCGLSMGGYVAWEFVRRYRGQVGKLILCDTRAIGDDPETARGRRVMAEHVASQGLTALAESMLPKLLAQDANPKLFEQLKANILDNDPKQVAAVMRGLAARMGATDLLPKIDVPTLAICGSEDVISTAAEMEQFAAEIPNAKFVTIPGAGHMAPMEKPVETNRAIEKFIAPH